MSAVLLGFWPAAAHLVAAPHDWPQWLGPTRDGLTTETGLLRAWPEGGPERVWLFRDCGLGYSGPSIVGGRLYVMGARKGVEQLIALDAATGDELWAADLGPEYENDWGNGPRGTPTVDDDRVYALAAEGALVCLSIDGGRELWRASMTDLGGEVPVWGYSESPLVDGGLVLATPGGEGGAVTAFDKLTGVVRWRSTDLTDAAHYSSIVAARVNGQRQYVQLLEKRLVAVDPRSGGLLWETPWPGRVAVVPTPIVRGNHIYITSGYGIGSKRVTIGPGNEVTVDYENKVMKNHHGGVILLGDHLYGHSDRAGWTCQEFATGKSVWRERGELGKGAIGYADGRFYCLDERSGEVALIAATTEGWREHGRFTLDPQTEQRKPRGAIWAHPVIVGGRLYLRDQELLFAFDVSAGRPDGVKGASAGRSARSAAPPAAGG